MLKTRVLTSLILAPPVLGVMFFAPWWAFELLVGVVMTGAAWEWASLMACTTQRGRLVFTATAAVLMFVVALGMAASPVVLPVVLVMALGWWGFVFGWLALRPQDQPEHGTCAWKGVCGLLTLVPAFAAIAALRSWPDGTGAWLVLYLLALVWVADVGAYFCGRAFGRRKLAPRVSPGKTWEGVAGAFVGAGVVIAVAAYTGLVHGPAWFFVALSLLTVAVSIVGDLAESMFKRQQGVKDSGNLLPGHGGVLDRIDSLTAAAPLFVGGLLVADQAF